MPGCHGIGNSVVDLKDEEPLVRSDGPWNVALWCGGLLPVTLFMTTSLVPRSAACIGRHCMAAAAGCRWGIRREKG